VTLGVSRHLEARESQACWPTDSAQATQGNSKPESRNAFWSNVYVQEQPALVPSAAMTASTDEPLPWRQWKTPRRRRPALLALGVRLRLASNTASSGRGPWYLAKSKALSVGLSNAYFKSLGLPTLIDEC
jgi:hypothetical protein